MQTSPMPIKVQKGLTLPTIKIKGIVESNSIQTKNKKSKIILPIMPHINCLKYQYSKEQGFSIQLEKELIHIKDEQNSFYYAITSNQLVCISIDFTSQPNKINLYLPNLLIILEYVSDEKGREAFLSHKELFLKVMQK